MAEQERKELIPTKFSASILAETNSAVDLQTKQIVLVRDKESNKWGLPAGKTMHVDNGKLEQPSETAAREWCEETGNLPMDFTETPKLYKTLFIHNQVENVVSMGFVFSATLDRDWPDQNFERDKKKILEFTPRKITSEFETDYVGLFNYHKVIEMLEKWQTKIQRPEINCDILLNWCNKIGTNYAANYMPGTNWEIPRESLNLTWQTREVCWGVNEIKLF